jgi:hypothetical protein
VRVARWRERYGRLQLSGTERDLPRGAPPVQVDVARLVKLTTQTKPAAVSHLCCDEKARFKRWIARCQGCR